MAMRAASFFRRRQARTAISNSASGCPTMKCRCADTRPSARVWLLAQLGKLRGRSPVDLDEERPGQREDRQSSEQDSSVEVSQPAGSCRAASRLPRNRGRHHRSPRYQRRRSRAAADPECAHQPGQDAGPAEERVDPRQLDARTSAGWSSSARRIGSTGLYPYAIFDRDAQIFDARQFPRSSGYPEDAATGIAAAALSFGLLANGIVEASARRITIRQGRAMQRPSEIRSASSR